MSHEDLQSLLGAYALDALESDEAVLLEAHLADCPRCRAEVAAHREAAALLGNLGGEAPPGVWDRIATELAFEHAPVQAPRLPANVLPLSGRRQLALPVVAAVAAVAAVFAGLLAVSTIRLQHRVDALRNTVSAAGVQQAAAAAVLDPNHTVVQLSSADGRFTAKVVIRPGGDAYLVSSDLPAVDAARTYQLWGFDNGNVVSLGLLGTNPRLAAFRVDSAVSRLMVNVEPKGGRPQPDTPILIQASLPA